MKKFYTIFNRFFYIIHKWTVYPQEISTIFFKIGKYKAMIAYFFNSLYK